MSEGERYEVDPNYLRISGEEDLDAVAVYLVVDDSGVQFCARTGSLSKRTFDLSYDEIDSVETVQDLSYGLVIENGKNEYTLTNVAADSDRIEEITGAIRASIGAGGENAGDTVDSSGDPSKNGHADGKTPADRLQKWADLHEQGIITKEEFEKKKRELLDV